MSNNATIPTQRVTSDDDVFTPANHPQPTAPASLLEEHGLVLNTTHQVLICIACKGIINPRDVRSHFLDYHKELKTRRTLQKEFDREIIHHHPNLTHHPILPTLAVPPLPGLAPPLPDFTQCKTCHHCYNTLRSFNLHQCSKPTPSTTTTHVQRFMQHNGSPWFPVQLPSSSSPPPPLSDPWYLYQKQAHSPNDASRKPATNENYRVLHQFLHKEQWISRVQGLKHEDLIPLVAYSANHYRYGGLHKYIATFLSEMQDASQAYYLRRLISTRPAEEHDQTQVRHHRAVNSTTIDAYARIVASVIACIHRVTTDPSPPYSFPVTPEVASTCKTLISLLSPSRTIDDPVPTQPEPRDHHDCSYESDDDSEIEEENEEEKDLILDVDFFDDSVSPIDAHLLKLLNLLFTQTPSQEIGGEFFSPLRHYVLLSAIRKNGQWLLPGAITHNIAALLFTGRLVFAWRIHKVIQKKKCTVSTYVPFYSIGFFFLKQQRSAFQTVEEYFLERTEAVLPNLYLLKRGLSGLHSAEQSALFFNAPDLSGQSAFIHGRKLELAAIKDLHLRAINEITSEIDELTFYLPQYRLTANETIYEEPRECKPGYSFVTDPRNSWNHHPSLVQHILQSEDLFQKYAYITHEKRVSWVPTLIAPVVERIFELQKKLLCLIILSYGEPARGTELASHLLANVPGGSIRNFFVLFNIPVLRGSFNKTSHQGTDRTICRFPLPELGEQFIRFLVYVRPLYFEWQRYLRPEMAHNAEHYLFAGLHRPIKSHDISSAMADYTTREFNVRLTL